MIPPIPACCSGCRHPNMAVNRVRRVMQRPYAGRDSYGFIRNSWSNQRSTGGQLGNGPCRRSPAAVQRLPRATASDPGLRRMHGRDPQIRRSAQQLSTATHPIRGVYMLVQPCQPTRGRGANSSPVRDLAPVLDHLPGQHPCTHPIKAALAPRRCSACPRFAAGRSRRKSNQ